jgi:hypothetical protein
MKATRPKETTPKRKHHWKRVLADAETSIKNVYSTTFFARRHIAIVDQQARSFNLCYALSQSGLITEKTRVAIIGAGFSGMVCAMSLAVRHDCIIQVLEREHELLKRFREAGFRYLHPQLNDRGWDIGPYEAENTTNFPFMNWSADYAPVVASRLRQEFEHFCQHTNIALNLGIEVLHIRNEMEQVILRLASGDELRVDIAILATGFGLERRPEETNDASYWHSGNPESYEPAKTDTSRGKYRILISGNGDSGVIELAHYVIRRFNHKNILAFVPSEENRLLLGDLFRRSVFNLSHRQIEEGTRDYPDTAGPISWYWWQRARIAKSADPIAAENFGADDEGRFARKTYRAIEHHLAGFEIGQALPPALLGQVENEIQEPLLRFASYEIRDMINRFKFKNIFEGRIATVFRRVRPVTVIGPTPTIYSARQSPINWFLLGLLERFGKVRYINARLKKARRIGSSIKVTLDANGKSRVLTFEKVVVRHGPDYKSFRRQRVKPKMLAPYFRPDYGVASGTDGIGRMGVENDLISYFRTKAWRKIAGMRVDNTTEVRAGLYSSDQCFLALSVWGNENEAEKLYRKLKKAKRRSQRMRYAVKLDSLRFKRSLGLSEKVSPAN